MTQEEKSKAYDGNYKTYTELINRIEDVKNAIKKQNYGIAMDILCKPYPEYQITTSTELKESKEDGIRQLLISFVKYDMPDNYSDDFSKEECLAWLEKKPSLLTKEKALKNSPFVEQNPAWSEEDEKHIMAIDLAASKCIGKWNCCGEKCPISEHSLWLKSLKERYTWKPSDGQMKALKEACDEHWEPDGFDPLYTLYQDLKKLKGE